MDDDRMLVSRLKQFGLSAKEAAVYLALLDQGQAKPSTLASEADVSTSYVYQLCENLEQAGLVTVVDHQTPTMMRAHPPKEGLGERLNQMVDTVTQLEQRYDRPTLDMESLETISSRETLFNRFRDVIASAESEIYLAVPLEAALELADTLRNAVDRGVLVLLVIGCKPEESSGADLENVATVARRWIPGMTAYLSVDLGRGIIAPASLLGWGRAKGEAITCNNFSINVAIAGAFLGATWGAAEEVFHRRPSSLPRTYDVARAAVYDATLHRRRGVNVGAEVIGRPTRRWTDLSGVGENDRRTQRTITGMVVGTKQNLIDPTNADFALECSLQLESEHETVSVGGLGSYLEDYEAEEIRLFEANS